MTYTMAKDITGIFGIGDSVDVVLRRPLFPVCVGSETQLRSHSEDQQSTKNVFGTYVGSRPGLIKVRPVDERLLAAPRDISRYVVISETQIKEAYKCEKVFP